MGFHLLSSVEFVSWGGKGSAVSGLGLYLAALILSYLVLLYL